jgi:hypothetical protein
LGLFEEPAGPQSGDKSVASGHCDTDKCVGPANPPSNPTGEPRDGIASNPLHQWCYKVAEGDTAGNIALRFVGNRSRYVELLSANPSKPQITSPELNFSSLCIGERLFIPKSWNPWIDEVGNKRESSIPFPPYDKLPEYPTPSKDSLNAGLVPWPPEDPKIWAAIPFSVP